MEISKLIEFNRLAREEGERYPKKRFLFKQIVKYRGKHFVGIAGPRGAGKTVILKQLSAKFPNSFYISLDTLKNINLFETVKELTEKIDIELFLIDEIHFSKNYKESLKKIYDFLDVKIIFTSSVALSLFSSSYDLSRRVLIRKLYPFTFREYLYFSQNTKIDPVSVKDIINKNWTKEIFSYADKFNDYLKGGNLPFALQEPAPLPLLKNIVDTVIRKDISMLGSLTISELDIIEDLLEFIGKSEVDGINYSALSNNLKITKYKAKQYVKFLEKAFILLRVMPAGTNVMKEPKILMAVPYRLIYRDYDEAIGPLREDFFVETLLSLGKKVSYLKSTRGSKTPDYLLKGKQHKFIIEIGGKSKGREQFKGVEGKKQLILSHSLETEGIKRPLFMAGFLK